MIGAQTLFYGTGAIIANRFGGHVRDITGSFHIPFTIAVGSALAAAILMCFVGKKGFAS